MALGGELLVTRDPSPRERDCECWARRRFVRRERPYLAVLPVRVFNRLGSCQIYSNSKVLVYPAKVAFATTLRIRLLD